MIIIDTNVVSEMMRDEPDPNVLAWTAAAGSLHATAITLAEIEYRIARLPDSRRKHRSAATAAAGFADFRRCDRAIRRSCCAPIRRDCPRP